MKIDALKIQTFIEKEPRRAQELFPQLIQKLIISTLNENGKAHFPKGSSIYNSGWDGIVKENTKINPYVPIGTSYWEIGTDKNAFSKIKRDYTKRKADPNITDKNEATYVAVVGKTVDSIKMNELEKKLSSDGVFKEVILFDANNIETWLETNFNVAIWFLNEIGEKIKENNIELLSKAWDTIYSSTNPKFDEDLYLIDNISTAQKLVEDISIKNNDLFIVNSKYYESEYAFTFIIAAIIKYGDDVLKEKCIIVNNINDLTILDTLCSNKIIIANISSFPTKILYSKNNSYILFENSIDSTYIINKVKKDSFKKALLDKKIFTSNIDRITINCESNIINLKRMFSINPYDKIPKWSRKKEKNQLIPLLLLGSINMENNIDFKIINELLGSDSNRDYYFESLNLWIETNDAPFFKYESIYKIKSRLECFNYIQIDIFSQKIKKLENFIKNIFLYDKVKLNDQVWFDNANDINKTRINDILDGFVILAIKSETNQQHYDKYVYQLLFSSFTPSNTRIDLFLIKLVELSPKGFLTFCEDKLITNEELIKNIGNRIDYILNSLEYVARFDGYFIEALNLILKLYFDFNIDKAKEKIDIMMSPLSIGTYPITISEKTDYFFNYIENIDDKKAKEIIKNLQHGLSRSIGIGIPDISYREYEIENYDLSINEAVKLQSRAFEWLLNHSFSGEYFDIFDNLLKRVNYDLLENIRKDLESFSSKIDKSTISNEEKCKINYRSLLFIYDAKRFENRIQNREILDSINDIYIKTINEDYYTQNKYIFKSDYFPIINPTKYDSSYNSEKDNQIREKFRIEKLNKMLEIYGENIFEKIINDINNISCNSLHAIASVCKDRLYISILLLKNKKIKELEIFIEYLTKEQKLELINNASIEDIRYIYSNMRVNNENINIVKNTSLEKYFWIGKHFDINSLNDNKVIIEKIIKFSPTSILYYISSSASFDPILAMKVLKSISLKITEPEYFNSILEERYYIQELIKYMDNNYYSNELAELEFKLFPLIFDYNKDYPLGIKMYFWNNPKIFGKMIIDICKNKDNLKENTFEREMYFEILYSFNNCFIPQENIILYPNDMKKWCADVLSSAINEDVSIHKVLKSVIINILVCCPMYPNTETWPNLVVASILEDLSKEDYENIYEVSNIFCNAFCKRKGLRTIDDGSTEIALGQQFLKFKKYYEKSYPVITKALEYISDGHKNDGYRDKIENLLSN